MKQLLKLTAIVLGILIPVCSIAQSGVAINPSGSPADSSAILDVSSPSQGMLVPRMTQAQRDAITNPAEGLVIFNTDTRCFNFYSLGAWFQVCGECIPPPAPVASNGGSICEGDTLFLFASSVPNVTYSWTGPNGFTSSQQNPVIYTATPSASGAYQVVAMAGSCSSSPASTSVNVYPFPSPAFSFNPASPGINSNVTFSAAVSGATYSWTFQSGNPATSNVQNPVVQWSSVGTYDVSLTITQNGCTSTLDTAVTVVSCTYTPGSQTFSYTGGAQTFTVPQCVNQITIECWGAAGAEGHYHAPNQPGGLGGYATGTLNVTPGETLSVYVGGIGTRTNVSPASGGFNGGGNGYNYDNTSWFVAGGGGASDVRQGGSALINRKIVAGGGGGAGGSGSWPNGGGGAGGGNQGGDGYDTSGGGYSGDRHGKGGTQISGGAGGSDMFAGVPGAPGTLGQGGNASTGSNCLAGGGGGGYYGGGGGSYHGGAGGGGSSYTGGVTGGSTQSGIRTGNGQVTISW